MKHPGTHEKKDTVRHGIMSLLMALTPSYHALVFTRRYPWACCVPRPYLVAMTLLAEVGDVCRNSHNVNVALAFCVNVRNFGMYVGVVPLSGKRGLDLEDAAGCALRTAQRTAR